MTDQDQVRLPDTDSGDDESAELPKDEGAEADLLDQSRIVNEEQVVERAPHPHHDVNEADWLEQHIVEPIDDELR